MPADTPREPDQPVREETTSELLSRKDDYAIEKLLSRYRPLLRAIVAREIDAPLRSKFDPSDVVQETCLEVVKAYPKVEFQRSRQFVTYIRQILVNKLHDMRRRYLLSRKRDTRMERPLDTEQVAAGEESPTTLDYLIDEELCQRTRQAMLTLPLEVQKILAMRFRKEMTYKEIGERIGRREDDVRMLIKRCLARIRQDVRLESTS